ncbi:PilT protein domain-containing protein, partial [Candidatus Thiomargarita nelsonii]
MRKQDIRTYTFSDDDRLFFDANIWIYIYGPLLSQQDVAISSTYAHALQKIRNAQSHLFIDALALSEFINTYARLEYRQSFANTYPTFKRFRKSS